MPNSNIFWPSVLLLGLMTFIIRFSFFFIGQRLRISTYVKDLFSFIPAIVFPALCLPMVYYHQGNQPLLLNKERFIIFLLTILLTLKIRSITFSVLFGLVVLYLSQ